MGKKGYTPRKKAYPSVQRDGIKLAEQTDKIQTVAYFWYVRSGDDGSPCFICDFCDGPKKTISLCLGQDAMRNFLEDCYSAVNASLFRVAEKIVLREINDPDQRWFYEHVLIELNIDALSDCLSDDFEDLTWEIISLSGEHENKYETIYSHLQAIYRTELKIRAGEVRFPTASCEQYFDAQAYDWPFNRIRLWYRPYIEGTKNPKPWELLAQHNVAHYAPPEYYDGMWIDGDYVNTTSESPVKLTISHAEFIRLLNQIDYRLKEIVNTNKKPVCD